jgi:hypothetical protein
MTMGTAATMGTATTTGLATATVIVVIIGCSFAQRHCIGLKRLVHNGTGNGNVNKDDNVYDGEGVQRW